MVVQRFFDAHDGTFSYLDWGGNGPISHIAHATGFCAGVYDPLAKILSSRLGVVGMDYRGHGKTTATANPENLKDWNSFADDLACFFAKLNQPVIAIGHSLGAVSSMLLAAERPHRLKALVLVDPTIMPRSLNFVLSVAQRLGLTGMFPIVRAASKRNSTWPDRSTIYNAYSRRAPFDKWSEGFLEAYLEYGFEELPSGIIKLRCEPAWESKCFSTCPAWIWGIPGLLKIPVLIIYGAQSDVFLEKSAKKFQSECKHVTLRKIDGVGHFAPMEKPHQTARLIFEFLEQLQIL